MKITSVTIAILIILIYYLYTVKDSFKVSFRLNDIKLNNINTSSLFAGQSLIQTKILFVVLYNAFNRIIISNLHLKLFYNNVLVAESSNIQENFNMIILLPNVNNLVYQTFDIKINTSSIDLVSKINKGQPYSVNYILTAKVFGIKINLNKIYQG